MLKDLESDVDEETDDEAVDMEQAADGYPVVDTVCY